MSPATFCRVSTSPTSLNGLLKSLPALLLAVGASVTCSSAPPPTDPGGQTQPGPPGSAGHSLVYATHLEQVVMVNAGLGGTGAPSTASTIVWGWNGTAWRSLDASGPPVRNLAGVAYDSRRGVLVMHGGSSDLNRMYGETWEWSASGWRQFPGPGPGTRDHTQMAFDASRGRAVLFGGSGTDPMLTFEDTWEFDGTSWTRAATTGPRGRGHHAMQFDPASNRVVLHGGVVPGGGTLDDTWTWNGTSWSQIATGTARSHARFGYHPRAGGLVLMGGFPATAGLGLQVFRSPSWAPLPAATEPSSRYLTDAAYDARRDVLVLFGGGSGNSLLSDTWEFDGNTWRLR